jgi:hypothetical protein
MSRNYRLPYQIADAMVPRIVDEECEGRDVLVAIAGLGISEMMRPALHFPARHPLAALPTQTNAEGGKADGG